MVTRNLMTYGAKIKISSTLPSLLLSLLLVIVFIYYLTLNQSNKNHQQKANLGQAALSLTMVQKV